jgi:hypothetical protein
LKRTAVLDPEKPLEKWRKLARKPDLSIEFRRQIQRNIKELKKAKPVNLQTVSPVLPEPAPTPIPVKASAPTRSLPLARRVYNFLMGRRSQ